MSPELFWDITPWQYRVAAESFDKRWEANHNHDAWLMWHGAALNRTSKKFPPLNDFMAGKKPVQGINENAIMTRLRQYKARFERENGS
jgi:hypothetical protein